MAAGLIGGAIVSAFIDILLNKMASQNVVNFFKHKKLNRRLLKLKENMGSVHKVLNDAEVKQITDPNAKAWLNDLRHVVYEADDFLDGIAYEALRLELEAGHETRKEKAKVRNSLSFINPHRKWMEEKEAQLENIIQNLESLIQQKDTLGLIQGIGEMSWSPKIPTALPVDYVVYGRDKDNEVIADLLLSDAANGGNPDVILIVGIGGVGKTTLAQFVYGDSRLQHRFDLKAWVCVSEEFDVVKVTKDVLKKVGSVNCDIMDPDKFHLELKKLLKGKKFLLVLDDVWNDDRDAWEFLLAPLKSASTQGSKIIVTTRDERVVSVMSTISPYHLLELNEDDCWFVFARHAFHDNGSSSAHGDLEEIGRKIVSKCKGLPLAAKLLGSLLCTNKNVVEWEKELKSILPALRLSYHYLPSHLKQCFVYCALFPKDYEFHKEDLILLWMAEGFLIQSNGKENEVGREYFNDLVSRSFFQQLSIKPSCFIMHDLVHDLAKFVSGEFSFCLKDDDSSKPSEKVRHLSHARTDSSAFEIFEDLHKEQFLRSFLLVGWQWWLESSDDSRKLDSLLSLEQLRILSLSNFRVVTELQNSIGNLKHLRYLNLQEMAIRRLPDSVSTLYHLQILILYECCELTELPTI